MILSTLEPGARFRLPECGKTGVLLSVGSAGARVKYDAATRQVEFQANGGDEVAFEAPGKPVLISAECVVELLP
jgi:hypothetical protein